MISVRYLETVFKNLTLNVEIINFLTAQVVLIHENNKDLTTIFGELGHCSKIYLDTKGNDPRDGEILSERWVLFEEVELDRSALKSSYATLSPFKVWVHKFYMSDDADLHDHPWDYISIIISGGYYEYLQDGSKTWRYPGHWKFSKAETAHNVKLKTDDKGNEIPAVTLFIPGKHKRHYGYRLKDGSWVHWKDYPAMWSTGAPGNPAFRGNQKGQQFGYRSHDLGRPDN